jgi:hypothetical protein
MKTPSDRRTMKALLSRLKPAGNDASQLSSVSTIVQIVVNVGTLMGLIVFGGWAIQKLDLRIKNAEVQSKEIGASYDKQRRIRIDHNLRIEPVKSPDATDEFEAAIAFKCTNTSRSEYDIRRVAIKFLKGKLAPTANRTEWFRINLPMQDEKDPILWIPLQTEAYVLNKDEENALKQDDPAAKNHGVGPTGLLRSDEAADWEEDYRFSGTLGDFVGFIITVRYADNQEWTLQEWGSIPKAIGQEKKK